MSGVLAIELLGGFRVLIDGRPIPAEAWRHRRAADLVKLLALSPRRRLHREQVMEALWPDLAPDAAAANLRKATHFARQALGSDGAIETRGGMVVLWSDGEVVLDAERFEAEARAAAEDGVAGAFTSAAARYAGDLLPEDRYASWTAEPRERLRRSYIDTLSGAGSWERILEIDPANENAHRALMLAHYETGNRTSAMRQFERLREALREELGVAPDPESVSLYEKVLAMEGREPPTLAERARSLLAEALGRWNMQDLGGAEQAAREARRFALEGELGRELGEASGLLGLVAHARGTWRDMFRTEFDEIVSRRPDLAEFVLDAQLCFTEFALHGPEGHDELAPFAGELWTRADESDSTYGRAAARLLLGELELFSGRIDDAERQLSAAVELYTEVGATTGISMSLERLAETAIARGRRWQAGRLLTRARRLAERGRLSSHIVPRVLCGTVSAASDAGRALLAVDAADSSLSSREVCQPCSIGYRVASTIACAQAGEIARAKDQLAQAERIAGMWRGGSWTAAVWEARGAVRHAEGDEAQAAAMFREAADEFARVKRPLDEARCRAAAGG